MAEAQSGFFARLKSGLSKTRSNLTDGLGNILLGEKKIDDDLLQEIDRQLLSADVGVKATRQIVENLTQSLRRNQLTDSVALYTELKRQLCLVLARCQVSLDLNVVSKPCVILMVGVNGAGKTTTIGKLAHRYRADGRSVMLAAGDTYRAAAIEQLQVWGERNEIPVIAQQTGADSASVIYDGLQAAMARNVDVLIADTAGRLQSKTNLMQELTKVGRVLTKLNPDAPHEVMLVIDAVTGQNAFQQAKQFQEAISVSGITLTKLDGTAKGGIIFAIAKQLEIPIRFIGIGEQIDDLRPFDAQEFTDALLDR
jgi:fused signal recognition particle receptor|tara:strand:- start:13655 stop:14587 length:933 start_codon:yes stop_codon:yes gene_type:complete